MRGSQNGNRKLWPTPPNRGIRWTMRWALFLLCALCCSSAIATTLYVDGVGASPEHFATVREALIALGTSGLGTDGASDEIAVTANVLLEPRGFVINGGASNDGEYPPVRDSVVIEGDADGDGNPCRLAVGDRDTLRPNDRITLAQASGQAIGLRDLVLMLDYQSSPYANFFRVIPGDPSAPLTGASLTLEDVTVTASLAGNVPQDPWDLGPRGNSVVSGFGEYDVFEVHQDKLGSRTTYRFERCAFAHHWADVLRFFCDQASIELVDTDIVDNGQVLRPDITWGTGLYVQPRGAVDLRLTRVTSALGAGSGLKIFWPEASEETAILVSGESNFSGNFQSGISLTGNSGRLGHHQLVLNGSPASPIFADGNRERGISGSLTNGGSAQLQDVVVCRNGDFGVYLSGASADPRWGLSYRHCLFAENSVIPAGEYSPLPGYNVITGAQAGVSVEFADCTFHEVVSTVVGTIPPFDRPTELAVGGTNIRMTNCILSGSSDEVAFYPDAIVSVDLTGCAVVLEGPHGLGALAASNEDHIHFHGPILRADPGYVDLGLPPGTASFDVRSVLYRAAGVGGDPLSGWGDYVGPLVIDANGWQLR
jgi:hypothetical protein